MFRQIPLGQAAVDNDADEGEDARARSPQELAARPAVVRNGTGDRSVALASAFIRYEQVGLRTIPSKVRDYDAVQDMPVAFPLRFHYVTVAFTDVSIFKGGALKVSRSKDGSVTRNNIRQAF